MKNFIYKIKNSIICLLVFCLMVDTIFVTPSFASVNVNPGAGDVTFSGLLTQDALLGYASKPRGARVSIWDDETNTFLRT